MICVGIAKIISKIERLRRKMCEAALRKGISHGDVLRMSQLLDKRLNKYYAIKGP